MIDKRQYRNYQEEMALWEILQQYIKKQKWNENISRRHNLPKLTQTEIKKLKHHKCIKEI